MPGDFGARHQGEILAGHLGARRQGEILAEAARAFGGAEGGVVFGVEALVEEGAPVVDALARRGEVGQRIGGKAEMGPGARPAPAFRPAAQPRSHGIELDVAEADVQTPFVERDRAEAALPEGAAPALALVDLKGVATVRLAERGGEAVRARGHEEQMDVVRHQAPGPDGCPCFRAAVAEQGYVAGIVVIRVECRLPPGAAGGDVMRDPRQDQSGGTRHTLQITRKRKYFASRLRVNR